MSTDDSRARAREAVERYRTTLQQVDEVSGQAAVDAMARHLQQLSEDVELRPLRLALVGSSTLTPLRSHLVIGCHRAGFCPEIWVAPYGQFRQQILDGSSELYQFAPEVTFLAVELEALLPGTAELLFADSDDRQRALDEVLHELRSLQHHFRQHCGGLLVVHNFVRPTWSPYGLLEGRQPGSLRPWYTELNSRLQDMAREEAQVCVLDMEALVAAFGAERLTDPRLWYLARMPYAETFWPVLARTYLTYVKALRGLSRKCIVLDLDNTLWGGVVGEESLGELQLGPSGIGQAFVAFQRMLLQFQRRGIVLAICSKNNEAEALAVLRSHPHMVLRPEHFAAWRINWDHKVTNLQALAREINLGLESIVFFDDSPAERFLVREALPQVLVPELPVDPAGYPSALAAIDDFSTLILTPEDMARARDYAAQRERRALQSTAGSLQEYLAALRTVAEVQRADLVDLSRLAQLTQRTNQFNLTTRRYSLQEVEKLSVDTRARLYSLRVTDRFGDSGIVGCAILRQVDSHPTWRVDTFLLSCRVIGRDVETAFLAAVAADIAAEGGRRLTGEYIPTDKNGVVASFFSRHGFSLSRDLPGGHRWWELSLQDAGEGTFPLTPPAHVTLRMGSAAEARHPHEARS